MRTASKQLMSEICTRVSLLNPMQYCESIWQFQWMLYANQISWDFCLMFFAEGWTYIGIYFRVFHIVQTWLNGYIYSSCYCHHQIGSIHLSHWFHIFSVVVCLGCLLHYTLSRIVYTFRENREFVFISIVQLMMNANSRIRFGFQIVFVCLYITPSHYHHCANFIWRHWTYKMPVRYNLSSVWVRLSIFCQLSIIQYVGLCVFSLPIPFVMIERIYILCLTIIIKSEVWTITHCLGLGHETMVYAVCLSIFLW